VADHVLIERSNIETRAVGTADAFAVEDAEMAALKSDPERWLAFLHGVRFGAMAAIEEIGKQTHG